VCFDFVCFCVYNISPVFLFGFNANQSQIKPGRTYERRRQQHCECEEGRQMCQSWGEGEENLCSSRPSVCVLHQMETSAKQTILPEIESLCLGAAQL
jgi:hypothetical protein